MSGYSLNPLLAYTPSPLPSTSPSNIAVGGTAIQRQQLLPLLLLLDLVFTRTTPTSSKDPFMFQRQENSPDSILQHHPRWHSGRRWSPLDGLSSWLLPAQRPRPHRQCRGIRPTVCPLLRIMTIMVTLFMALGSMFFTFHCRYTILTAEVQNDPLVLRSSYSQTKI
ncbi:hypothetical protein CPB83DRAFT_851284 [Crepidotus variabilis]|uniref:Uncharacterized protein n=1 Tax=Crepidotus variabilis TaxID=179855 RepID=A0A9P6EJM8_9AGAR|nr:hypothetical protein CPB83DRAFT_851284 [Crepidotus variabilis]